MKLRAYPAGRLSGSATVPGDKSISHRALMLAAMAVGESRITACSRAPTCSPRPRRCAAWASPSSVTPDGLWQVQGVGVGGLREPDRPLDLGNSGTGARLLLGLLAGHPFTSFMTGDDSLRSRPMARVTEPLARDGRPVRDPQRRPPAARGHRQQRADADPLRAAGRLGPGQVRDPAGGPARARPHHAWSSRRPRATTPSGCCAILAPRSRSSRRPRAARRSRSSASPSLARPIWQVPGCASSAAFPLVAAALVEGSALRLEGVGVNPLRTGLIETLGEMGARLRQGEVGGGRAASRRPGSSWRRGRSPASTCRRRARRA